VQNVYKDNFTELPDKLHKNRVCFLHVDNVNGSCSHVLYSSLQSYFICLCEMTTHNLSANSDLIVKFPPWIFLCTLGGLERPSWKSN